MDKVKILFLASDPSDSNRLRLGQELRDIRDNLQRSRERDRFLIESRESVRPSDITQSIFDVDPQIVHFSGHGRSTGELCFESIIGTTKPVQPDALANLFELVSDRVHCVVLNACYSEQQAKAISAHIPFVLGMKRDIGDRAALTFAVGFYKALGDGKSFEEAYQFARVEIRLEGITEHLIPVLYINKKIVDVQKIIRERVQHKKTESERRGGIKKYFAGPELKWTLILFSLSCVLLLHPPTTIFDLILLLIICSVVARIVVANEV